MRKLDEDLLICDMAETYGVLDYRCLPLTLSASLAYGLRSNSRIKIKMSGISYDMNQMMMAGMLDRLSLLVYAKTKDGQKGKNYPKMLVQQLTGNDGKEKVTGFKSGEDFMKMRAKILGGKDG